MTELPLTFQSKSQLLSGNANQAKSPTAAPSTCVDAEPYALQVLDESMAPEFWSGCIILIDPTGRATDGSFVLATTHPSNSNADLEQGEYVFRQLQRQANGEWALVAFNTSFPPITIDQQLNGIVGVIVQRAGKRRSQHKRYDQQ